MNDDTRQSFFDFYGESAPKAISRSLDNVETEDDVLDILLNQSETTDENDTPDGGTLQLADMPDDLPPWESADKTEPTETISSDLPAAGASGTPDEIISQTAEPVPPVPAEIVVKSSGKFPPMNEQTLRRAALGFLAGMKPDGIGELFASGIPRTKVDAGAYYTGTGRKSVSVERTILALTCMDREKCWIDASEKATLLTALAEAKARKAELEEMLKVKEPELKDDSLFPETQTWDFARTKNRKYHACLRRIGKIEYSIYHGSKFERMRFEQTANEYYLIVPEKLIAADELPEEWGLVYIAADMSATVIREAQKHDCPPENRVSFALRAAASVTNNALFARGILNGGNKVQFAPVPKRRRAYKA